ncbi:MAG TPA: 1-acyl-sn-glycerol-3-phosphate acyltransferase [Blastocatellia bacterium]|nr:1-acyl-sn-glycerol-3-phosphate acyltransferase [Blastocatellia bacterium]
MLYRLQFVAKASLFSVPVLGFMSGGFRGPVMRRSNANLPEDYQTFFAVCVEATAPGNVVVIFPEGRLLLHPAMTLLSTGAARLFSLPCQRGMDTLNIPVGLNGEQGAIPRSPVLISITPLIDAQAQCIRYQHARDKAVRELTLAIAQSLQHYAFQAGSFRHQTLMPLSERLRGRTAYGVSRFTLLFFERYKGEAMPTTFAHRRSGRTARRAEDYLARLRQQIITLIDALEARVGRQASSDTSPEAQ